MRQAPCCGPVRVQDSSSYCPLGSSVGARSCCSQHWALHGRELARKGDKLAVSNLVPGPHCLTAGAQGWFQKRTEPFSTMLTMLVSGGKSSQAKRFPLNLKHVES